MNENGVIEEYVRSYEKAQDFFYHAAEQCHARIHDALSHSGIRHIASFRAKQVDRLKAKLYQRHDDEKKVYRSREDIDADIVDLAGVRVALYFPAETDEALRIIRGIYNPDSKDEKTFPLPNRPSTPKYRYRFPGYVATHLRVVLGADTLDDKNKHRAGTRVEVQVASMFMHAWAEVEHDLVYKPSGGLTLSADEYSWLDQINGLAMAGDLALEQLQRTMNERIADAGKPFRNHYDLASFLHSRATGDATAGADPRMGRADKLLAFLTQLRLDQPSRLEPYLENLSTGENAPLVTQVAEAVIRSNPDGATTRRALWQEIDGSTEIPSPYGGDPGVDDGQAAAFAIRSRLLKHWATLDAASRAILARKSERPIVGVIDWLDLHLVIDLLSIDHALANRLIAAHQAMTRLQFGNWHGSNDDIEKHADTVREVIRRVYSQHADLPERGNA